VSKLDECRMYARAARNAVQDAQNTLAGADSVHAVEFAKTLAELCNAHGFRLHVEPGYGKNEVVIKRSEGNVSADDFSIDLDD